MESKAKYHYFKAYARGEPILLLLNYLKIEWEHVEVPFPPLTPELKAKYEFGKVPMLEIDGLQLVESKSIMRYLALKHGMHPTDPVNNYKVNSLVDRYVDFEGAFYKAFFTKEEEKAQAFKDFHEKEVLPTLGAIEKRLKENTSQDFIVGDKLTIADILWVNFVWSHALNPTVPQDKKASRIETLEKFPLYWAYVQKRKADFPYYEKREASAV